MKLNLIHSKRNVHYLYFTSLFLFFFYLSYNTPLTGDDWTWGTHIGMDRLLNKFTDYNGRYLSNILEIVLTRYDLLRYITFAIFSTLLVYIVGKLTDHSNKKTTLMLSFIFFLLIPTNIFSQTFGWTAGFVNYVPSVALLLLFVFIVRNILEESSPYYNKWLTILMIPLGLTTQLIVEHVSLFSMFTAACVIIYTYFKHKRFYSLHLTYLASLLIGSIIMFTNGAYLNVLNGTDTYRAVGNEITNELGLFARIYHVYSGNMYKFVFLDNVVMNLFIGVMVIILIVRFVSKSKWINFVIKPVLLTIISGFILYLLVFSRVLGDNFLGTKTNDFEALFSALFFVSIIMSIALFVKITTYKLRLFYYLSGIVLLTAPFVFITPFGPRCVFGTYTFMVLVGLELFSYHTNSESTFDKHLIKPLLASILVLVIGYTFIFAMNGSTNRERLTHLENEVNEGKELINLRQLPYPQFHWMSSPEPSLYQAQTFKTFYEVPSNTEIQFVPYFQWKE